MVASRPPNRRSHPANRVSIPFIAGQWSLRFAGSFYPNGTIQVSIPFIAGQWSLQLNAAEEFVQTVAVFQSPSLRGSGRFKQLEDLQKSRIEFQSPSLRGSGRFYDR